jgi:hypothetical protein
MLHRCFLSPGLQGRKTVVDGLGGAVAAYKLPRTCHMSLARTDLQASLHGEEGIHDDPDASLDAGHRTQGSYHSG